MSEAIKPTPGPLRVQADDKWPFYIRTFDAAGDCVFREDMPTYSTAQRCLAECLAGKHMSGDAETSVRANIAALVDAELRAEAHNVLTDTGLRPSQLVERVKELEEALRKYEDVRDDMFTFFMSNGIFNQWGKRYDCSALNNAHLQASAALSKALPNTVAEVK